MGDSIDHRLLFFDKGMDWEEVVSSYLDVVELCIWFQAQVRTHASSTTDNG